MHACINDPNLDKDVFTSFVLGRIFGHDLLNIASFFPKAAHLNICCFVFTE